MARFGTINIGTNYIRSRRSEIRLLKKIFDKLELPYILDDISFHNTVFEMDRIRTVHNTRVWKVEKDGSIDLTNRFGHNGRFEYRYLSMPNLVEFQFVDFSLLTDEETEFLGDIIFEADTISAKSSNHCELLELVDVQNAPL
jgi:hypothetical protein